MTIPLPEGPAPDPGCAWCGDKPTTDLILEKPRYTVASNGTRVVKRRAVVVPVCPTHRVSLNPREF